MGITRRAAEDMIEQGAARLREIARLEAKYGPEPDEFAVVRVQARLYPSGRLFSYAIIRGGGKWYITGTSGADVNRSGISWEAVCEWLERVNEVLHFEVLKPPAEFRKPGE